MLVPLIRPAASLRIIARMASSKAPYSTAPDPSLLDNLVKSRGWSQKEEPSNADDGKARSVLHKDYKLRNFKEAWALMGIIADKAEELNVREQRCRAISVHQLIMFFSSTLSLQSTANLLYDPIWRLTQSGLNSIRCDHWISDFCSTIQSGRMYASEVPCRGGSTDTASLTCVHCSCPPWFRPTIDRSTTGEPTRNVHSLRAPYLTSGCEQSVYHSHHAFERLDHYQPGYLSRPSLRGGVRRSDSQASAQEAQKYDTEPSSIIRGGLEEHDGTWRLPGAVGFDRNDKQVGLIANAAEACHIASGHVRSARH